MLKIRSRFYVVPTLLFLGTAFAMANGLGYGSGNLRQYLLHGLHAINPGFLANDWFTTQTHSHHSAFDGLIILLARAWRLDIAFAFANALFAMILLGCVYLIARRFYRTPLLVTALAALLLIFVPRPYIGWTVIINNYFQPSTIGAVGLLAGLTCLCGERFKTAGVILLIAGVFHINYMVWAVLLVGIVVAINLNRMGVRRALYVIVPISLSVLYHLPFIGASRSVEQTVHSAFAATILHDVYMPFHSRPLTWGIGPFIRFGLQMMAGGIAVWAVPLVKQPSRITRTLLAAIVLVVLLGMVFTAVFPIDTVALIFPYRLAPYLILLSQIAVAGAIITSAQSHEFTPLRAMLLWVLLGVLLYGCGVHRYGLSILGVVAVAVLAGRVLSEPDRSWMRGLLILGGLSVALFFGGGGRTGLVLVAGFVLAGLGWKMARRRRWIGAGWPVDFPGGPVILPLCIAVFLMRIGSVRKDLAGPPPAAEEQVLYAWCRGRTSSDAVFIIPPQLAGFRLGAGRAVVADWKCMPILPKETVEWYRRLAAICGGGFRAFSQAKEGFLRMDSDRASRLAREYGARYLVTYRDQVRPDLRRLQTVFADDRFAVFDLGTD